MIYLYFIVKGSTLNVGTAYVVEPIGPINSRTKLRGGFRIGGSATSRCPGVDIYSAEYSSWYWLLDAEYAGALGDEALGDDNEKNELQGGFDDHEGDREGDRDGNEEEDKNDEEN